MLLIPAVLAGAPAPGAHAAAQAPAPRSLWNPGHRAPLVPADAPDWTAVTLDGDTLSMRSMRGDVVVLDFWGTWCPPCIAWLPRLMKLEHRYAGRPVRFVTVNVESIRPRARQAEYVRDFMKRHHFDLTVVPDADSTIVRAHDIEIYPTVMVVDADGRIAYANSGASDETEASLTAELDGLLAPK